MFKNIDDKIKALAEIIFAIGCFASLCVALVMFNSRYSIGIGLGCMFGGPLFFYIDSIFIYGFGELLSCAKNIKKNTEQKESDDELPEL